MGGLQFFTNELINAPDEPAATSINGEHHRDAPSPTTEILPRKKCFRMFRVLNFRKAQIP